VDLPTEVPATQAEPDAVAVAVVAAAAAEKMAPIRLQPAQPVPAQPVPESGFSLDALLGVVTEAASRAATDTPTETVTRSVPTATENARPPASDPMLDAAVAANEAEARSTDVPASDAAADTAPEAAGPAGPAFEVRPDGSISVEGVGVIAGSGTAQRPFVLDWQALRSLSRDYNPRQGESELPGWVMEMHDKFVRIEGNTLLPVVSQMTNELLVMQNPWDGCCLGVPPTPYDAIEVKLARMTRMGNSPTGFGQVEGVFKVDPYIVSGWLLGLYVIEEASFESASGGVPAGL
jgi:hypothetical protein